MLHSDLHSVVTPPCCPDYFFVCCGWVLPFPFYILSLPRQSTHELETGIVHMPSHCIWSCGYLKEWHLPLGSDQSVEQFKQCLFNIDPVQGPMSCTGMMSSLLLVISSALSTCLAHGREHLLKLSASKWANRLRHTGNDRDKCKEINGTMEKHLYFLTICLSI
jgi:hypothetical protein